MEAGRATSPSEKRSSIFLLARLAVVIVPILSFLGYYMPYVIGLSYHQHLLSLYDVPSGLFEVGSRQTFIYAYQAILEVSGNWLNFITHSFAMPLVFFCALLFLTEISLFFWMGRSTKLDEAIDQKITSKRGRLALAVLVLSAAITALVAALPVALYPLIAFPARLGIYGSDLAFEREKKLFKGGCGVENTAHVYCKAVIDGDKVLGIGFMIVASDSRVALYQPDQTTIVKLGDAAVQVLRPEQFKKYQATLDKP